MNLHEYQSKRLFADYGIPVPRGIPAESPNDAVKAAQELGGDLWVVKAQVHAGGRGKAGGVKLARSMDEVREFTDKMLGTILVTHQTGPEGLPVNTVYLDGNSLGALPKATRGVMQDAVTRQWGQDLIRSWNNHDWIGAPQRVGGKIAGLIGVEPQEVIVADSVSVNIFKLLTAVARNRPKCTRILSEANNFPTDVHVAQGVAEVLGLQLELAPREELLDRLDAGVAALLLVSLVYLNYRLWRPQH